VFDRAWSSIFTLPEITCMLKGCNIYSHLNVKNNSGSVHINVTLRRIHRTIVAVGKQYYII
jgi:hypothetical protein